MHKNAILGLFGALVVIAGVAWYAGAGRMPMPSDTASNINDAAVRAAAAGFATSSQRVDVVSVEQIGEGAVYRVEANVIQLSADALATPLGVQPVTLMIEQQGEAWVITEAERGAYSELPQRQTVVGFWECLPKKGPGPHTMECAFGIAKDQSDGHLAVNTQLMSRAPVDYPVGTKVRIEGVVTPAQMLSSDQWRSYDIDGIINATSIEIVQ